MMVRPAGARGRCRRCAGSSRRWRRRSGSRGRRARRGCAGTPRWGSRWPGGGPGRAGRRGWRVDRAGRLGGPAAGDELAVPAQDGGRRDEQPEASAGREQSGEGGDQGAVGPAHPRPWRAPLEHGELVAQDQDLDVLGGVGSGAQHDPAQELGEHLVDQPQRHRRIMPGTCRGRTSRSRAVCTVSGTHRPGAAAAPGCAAGCGGRGRGRNAGAARDAADEDRRRWRTSTTGQWPPPRPPPTLMVAAETISGRRPWTTFRPHLIGST